MARLSRWFAVDELDYDDKAVRKQLKPAIAPVLRDLHDSLAKLDDWSRDAIETVFQQVLGRHGDLKIGKLAQPVRVAVTGGTVSPGIFETLAVLGPPRALTRLARALELIDVS